MLVLFTLTEDLEIIHLIKPGLQYSLVNFPVDFERKTGHEVGPSHWVISIQTVYFRPYLSPKLENN